MAETSALSPQRALLVILVLTIPYQTICYKIGDSGTLDTDLNKETVLNKLRRYPFSSWATGKSPSLLGSDITPSLVTQQETYLPGQNEVDEVVYEVKRAPFNSWAGKRAPFNSWAGKRSPWPFSPWAGKRAPFNAWAGK